MLQVLQRRGPWKGILTFEKSAQRPHLGISPKWGGVSLIGVIHWPSALTETT